MMRKVQIDEPGDTRFLEQQVVDRIEFNEENDAVADGVERASWTRAL